MIKKLDTKGKACPLPVIMSKKALKEGGFSELHIILDNEVSKENVIRALKKQDCQIGPVEQQGQDFIIKVFPSGQVLSSPDAGPGTIEGLKPAYEKSGSSVLTDTSAEVFDGRPKKTALFISKDTLGTGSPELGALLMKAHLYTLTELDNPPSSLLFMNGGVKLTLDSSPCLDNIKTLEKMGVTVLVCGTCLDFFDVTDKCRAGIISNMYDITDALLKADNTITIS
jgi:selenium metabolism protein YedF